MKLKPKFQSKSKFKDSRQADVLLVYCSDFRFRKAFWEFQDAVLGKNRKIDRVVVAGGHLSLLGSKYGYPNGDSAAKYWLKFLVKHHNIPEIVFVGHAGCAAYSSAKKLSGKTPLQLKEVQAKDLARTKQLLGLRNIKIKLYFAEPDERERIRFSEVG